MTDRRSLSPTRRVKIFEDAGGRCHICEGKIFGKEWDVEHVIPLALGGADDASNMRPAHKSCHGEKTKADAASWSKAKRIRAKHIGAKRPSGFQSKYRKKMNGEVVLR
jgi:5-methylcytosine-specific restriction protein A